MITRIYKCPLYESYEFSNECVHRGDYNSYADERIFIPIGCEYGREICCVDIDTDVCTLDYKEIYDQLMEDHKSISEDERNDLLKICYEMDSR